MFQQPKRSSTTVIERPSNLDLDARYVFKVLKLEDKGVSKFADPAKGEDFHDILWEFHIAHAETKTLIYGPDGEPWVFVDYTTSKIGRNPKNGMVAKARVWIEAFLGHPVETDEITAETPSQLIGKYAAGFFEEPEITGQDGTTYRKLKILRLSAYKAGSAPVEVKAPSPPPPAPTGDLPF